MLSSVSSSDEHCADDGEQLSGRGKDGHRERRGEAHEGELGQLHDKDAAADRKQVPAQLGRRRPSGHEG